ncbi:MAG TPA: Uma2 family endonuclease, partial [Candidatus Saccharimonadia bacterium]|nr:Uma2 family endonuclease [Candidatus Saccharimonadia bacterium]
WQGKFEDREDIWLRWCDREGQMLLTGAERAEQEHQRAEQEHQRAEQEHQRAEQERVMRQQAQEQAERLAARLRELGIEPDQVI